MQQLRHERTAASDQLLAARTTCVVVGVDASEAGEAAERPTGEHDLGDVERPHRQVAREAPRRQLVRPVAEQRRVEDNRLDAATGEVGARDVREVVGVAGRPAEAHPERLEEADHERRVTDERLLARARGRRRLVADQGLHVRERELGRVVVAVGEHEVVARHPHASAGKGEAKSPETQLTGLEHDRRHAAGVGGEGGAEPGGAAADGDDVRRVVPVGHAVPPTPVRSKPRRAASARYSSYTLDGRS